MANPLTHCLSSPRNAVTLIAVRASFAAADTVPTLNPACTQQGVTIAKTGTGTVRISFASPYTSVLGVVVSKQYGTTPAAGYWRVANALSTSEVNLVHATDAAPATGTNPEAGSSVHVLIAVRNSAV